MKQLSKMPRMILIRPATYFQQSWWKTLDDVEIGGVRIPAGTETDGATLPRFVIPTALILILLGISNFWFSPLAFGLGFLAILVAYLFPPFGAYAVAALLHDMLLLQLEDRTKADRKMKEVLKDLGITEFHQTLMYRLVRLNTFKDKFIGGSD